MTNKASVRLTLIASTGLCLYAVYKIVQLTARTFNSLYLNYLTLGEKWWHLLIYSNYYWLLLALGLCGCLFVYADTNKNEEIDFQKRFVKIKKIVFSILILFSSGTIFLLVYHSAFSSLNAYLIYGGIANSLLDFLLCIVAVVAGVSISVGGIIFGIYNLSGNERLRKVVLPIYLTGFISMMILSIYNFLHPILFYIREYNDSKVYGITANRICEIILSLTVDILIVTASLIIVLYGIKKKRTVLDEKLNITDETAITSTPASTPRDS